MAEFKHGEMNITEQTKTFESFVKFGTWSVVVILVFLVALAVFAS